MIRRLAPALLAGVLGGILMFTQSDLRAKNAAQKSDKSLAVAIDWEDVVAFNVDLRGLAAQSVVMAWSCRPEDEMLVRRAGLRVLWRLDNEIEPDRWLMRFQPGDSVFVAGDHVLEHPRLFRELADTIRSKNGTLAMMEFVPDKLLPIVAARIPDHLIKSHLLATREMIYPKPALWHARLVRAVNERWVRLLVIRFSPAWTRDQNMDFQKKLFTDLEARGYSIGRPQPFRRWTGPGHLPVRFALIFLIVVVTPVVIFSWALESERSPYLIFILCSFLSLLAGVTCHALGSHPAAVIGLQMLRGIKLQLVLPLALSGFLLLTRRQWLEAFEAPIKLRHAALILFFLVGVAGIYVMRSGNFPALPVSDGERSLRDLLDRLFVARPRFKEFLIGHPLFLIGFTLKRKAMMDVTTARFLLWLGLIGQISILNTFLHFHSPLDIGLLRSLHGIWLGCCVAAPACLLLNSRR